MYDRNTRSGSKSREQMLADQKKLSIAPRNHTFGIAAAPSDNIGSLISGSFVPEEKDGMYPATTAAKNRAKKKAGAKRFDSSKPTKASMGRAQALAAKEAKANSGFKMKRFDKAKSRLGGAGNQIVNSGR